MTDTSSVTAIDPRGPAPDPRTDLGPFSGQGATARPWAQTMDALRRSQKFTVCTVRADGRPHATPLLAIWAGNGLFFGSGDQEQKAVNLRANPHCILRAGSEGLTGVDYVVEGSASVVTDADVRGAVADAFELSYGWHLTGPDGTWRGMGDMMRSGEVNVYALAPSIIFAFGNGEPFSQTRYHFRAPAHRPGSGRVVPAGLGTEPAPQGPVDNSDRSSAISPH